MCHWNEINDKVEKKQNDLKESLVLYKNYVHAQRHKNTQKDTWWCKKTLSYDITHLIFFTFPAVLQHFKKYIFTIVQKKPSQW